METNKIERVCHVTVYSVVTSFVTQQNASIVNNVPVINTSSMVSRTNVTVKTIIVPF